jgi:hypothetical protein
VYECLCSGPNTSHQIAAAIGITEPTVEKHLKRLSVCDLATEEDRLWRPLSADLDRLAVEIGVAGKGEQQALRHAREREAHTIFLVQQEALPRGWVDRLVTAASRSAAGTGGKRPPRRGQT